VLSASAAISGEAAKRLARITELFGATEESTSQAIANPFDPKARAS